MLVIFVICSCNCANSLQGFINDSIFLPIYLSIHVFELELISEILSTRLEYTPQCTMRVHFHTHIHTFYLTPGKWQSPSHAGHRHAFRQLEKTQWEPTCMQLEHVKLSTDKNPISGLNPGPWISEEETWPTAPPCCLLKLHHSKCVRGFINQTLRVLKCSIKSSATYLCRCQAVCQQGV